MTRLDPRRRGFRLRIDELEDREVPAAFGFARQIGGNGFDFGDDVVTDASGNVYASGFFEGTAAQIGLVSNGASRDAYVAKYRPDGIAEWATPIGGSGVDQDSRVAVAPDGSVYVTGCFTGSMLGLISGSAGRNGFVCKLNNSGVIQWVRGVIGTGTDDLATGIAADADGNVVVTGYFRGTATFGGTVTKTAADADAYVWKLSSTGTTLGNVMVMGGSGVDSGLDIALDGAGGLYVGGTFQGSDAVVGGVTLNNAGNGGNGYIARFAENGSLTWVKTLGGPGNDEVRSMAVNGQGDVFVSGRVVGNVTFGSGGNSISRNALGVQDGYIAKLNSAGTFQWANLIGGAGEDGVSGITVDSAGNVYAAGAFEGTADFDPGVGVYAMTSTVGGQPHDAYVTKWDTNGNFVFARKFGSGGSDAGYAVAVDNSGSLYSTGYFQNTVDFDPSAATANLAYTGSNTDTNDAYLIKLVQATVNGVAWKDTDSDGVRDLGEPLLAGVVAELIDSAGTSWGTQVTGADGAYSFIAPPNDAANAYTVQFRAPSGLGFTQNDVGTDATDSDVNLTVNNHGKTDPFDLPGNATVSKDAGLIGTVTGFGFVATVGSPFPERTRAVATDAAGFVYTAGTFFNTVDFDPSGGTYNVTATSGGVDAYVAKYTSGGALVWAKGFSGGGGGVATGVAVGPDGGVFITGLYAGPETAFGPAVRLSSVSNSFDIFVAKLDADGDVTWAKSMGGSGYDSPNGIAVDGEGNVVTTGFFIGTADFDPSGNQVNLAAGTGNDAFVSKLDASGNYVWAKRLGSGANGTEAEGYGVAVDQDGYVYAAGHVVGDADYGPGVGSGTLVNPGLTSGYLMKISPIGDFVWTAAVGGAGEEVIQGVTTDAAGIVYLTGYFNAITPFGPSINLSPVGGHDIFVAKLDGSGGSPEYVWAKGMGGGNNDYGRGIAVDNRGHVFTTGGYGENAVFTDFDPGPGVHTLPLATDRDAFVSELDADGNFVLARATANGAGEDDADRIAVDNQGGIYTVGYHNGVTDFDPSAATTSRTANVDSDGFLSKIVQATVAGLVWADDGDGVREIGEPLFAGATLELIDGAGVSHGTRVTGADGAYTFTAPPSDGSTNEYHLFVRLPSGYGLAPKDQGGDGTDSDINHTGPNIGQVIFYPPAGLSSNDVGLVTVAPTFGPPAFGLGFQAGGNAADEGRDVELDAAGNMYVTGHFTGTVDFDPSALSYNISSASGSVDAYLAKFSPGGSLVWVRTFGSSGNDQGIDLDLAADGSIVVTGIFQNTVDFDPGPQTVSLSATAFDAFVSKFDADGDFVWARRMGGSDDDLARTVTVDNDGNIISAGYFHGTADFNPDPGVNLDLSTGGSNSNSYVQKLNPAGNLIWVRQFTGPQFNYAHGVTTDDSGTVYVTGSFSGTTNFGGGISLPLVGGADGYVAKLSRTNGIPSWVKPFSGTANEYGNKVAVDAAGNVYTVGNFNGTADFDPDAATAGDTITSEANTTDIFVSKRSFNGALLWVKRIGAAGDDVGLDIALDAAANVHITGYFHLTVDFNPGVGTDTLTSAGGSQDVFVAKLDTNGNFVLARRLGGSSTELGYGLTVDGVGAIYTTGYFVSSNFDPSGTPAGPYTLATTGGSSIDMFVSKLLPPSVVNGVVWDDKDGDGVRDAGEPLVAGAVAELTDSASKVVGTRITGADGAYSFDVPPDASTNAYKVQFRPPSGFNFTLQDVGTDGTDSDAIALTGRTPGFPVGGNATVSKDAGLTGAAPAFGFATAIGKSESDTGIAVTTDAAGNVYVTGTFSNQTDFDPSDASAYLVNNLGGLDAYVAKYTAGGALVWAKGFGGPSDDDAYGVVSDAAGNVYVTGSFQGSADFDSSTARVYPLTGSGNRDAFVAKLEQDGDLVWARQLSGTGDEAGVALGVDAQGNVYSAGRFSHTVDFNPNQSVAANLTSAGSYDAYISKLDADGTFVWAVQQGGTQDDRLADLWVDAQGNTYSSGYFGGTMDFVPGGGATSLNTAGANDGFVSKRNASGAVMWTAGIGGSGNDSVRSVTQDGGGNLWVSGSFAATADFNPAAGQTFNLASAGGGADAYAAKLDGSGNFIWAGAFGGAGAEHATAVATDNQGNVFVTGTFTGTADFDPGDGAHSLTTAGDHDVFVTQLNSSGQFVLARRMGGVGGDEGSGVAVDPQGGIYTTGLFNNTADFDPSGSEANLVSAQFIDGFLSKIVPPSVVNGVVWEDRNNNNQRDNGEPAVAGAVAELIDSTGKIVGQRITGADGAYSFEAPPDAEESAYRVQFRPPAGFAFIDQDIGGDATDSDADAMSGSTENFALPGNATVTRDAGLRGGIPAYGFAAPVGGLGTDRAYSVATDAAGNIYVGGSFQGAFTFGPGVTVESNDGVDAYVAKYTPVGALVWVKTYGNNSSQEVQSLAVTPDGYVAIGGYFLGTMNFGSVSLPSEGSADAFVARLDPDGDLLWAKQIGSTGGDNGYDVATDAAGNVYLAGHFAGTVDLDPGPGTPVNRSATGASDGFLLKLTPSGGFGWVKQVGGSGEETVRGVAVDATGNAYIGGHFGGGLATFGDGVSNIPGAGDEAYVAKIDAAGAFVWAKSFGGSGQEAVYDLALDAASNVYTTGYFTGTANFDPADGPTGSRTSAGGGDVFVSKLDANGVFQWANRFGGVGTVDYGQGVTVDSAGRVFAVGEFLRTAAFDPGVSSITLATPNDHATLPDAYLIEFTPAGGVAAARRLGNAGRDVAYGVAASPGRTYVVGEFSETVDFDPSDAGTDPRTSEGGTDTFVVQLAYADITGAVFDDLDADGLQDSGENGLPNATIELIDPVDDIIDNGNDVILETQITAANGSYRFGAPSLGRRYLRISPPAGLPREITVPGPHSDVDAFGLSTIFNLRTDPIQTWNAGLRTIAAIEPGWAIGAGGANAGRGVVTDANGDTFVVGSFTGTVDFDPSGGSQTLSAAGQDVYVAKYSSAGVLIWARKIGGSQTDSGYGITLTADGGVCVTGSFQGTADFDPSVGGNHPLTSPFGTDGFVCKLSAAGNFMWATKLGGAASTDFGVAISADSLGNVFVAGCFAGEGIFGSHTLTSAGDNDGFVCKINASNGAVLWAKKTGGAMNDAALGVVADGNGGAYVTGSFQGATANFGNISLNGAGADDAFVGRLDANGAFVWAVQFGGPTVDLGRGIAADTAGNVYVTGSFSGHAAAGALALDSEGSSDAFVAKLSSAGTFAWISGLGGSGADAGFGVAADDKGNVYSVGRFSGTADFGAPLVSVGPSDLYLSRLDANGQFSLARRMGGAADDGGYALSIDQSLVTVAGFSQGTAGFDPGEAVYQLTIPANPGSVDGFLGVLVFPEVRGEVWDDLNGDGVRDVNDNGLPGALVELIDSATGQVLETRTTDAGGNYVFGSPLAGNRYLRFSSPAGTGGNDAVYRELTVPGSDSDANGVGNTPAFDLRDNPLVTLDAGFRTAGTTLPGWAVGAGGTDTVKDVAYDSDGNAYIVGSFSGTVDFDRTTNGVLNLVSDGPSDGFVAKYKPTGQLEWVRQMGGPADDEATGVAVDTDDNLFVTGTVNGQGTFGFLTPAPKGLADAFLAKLDDAGTFLWAHTLGGAFADTGAAVAVDALDNAYVAGTFTGNATIAGTAFTNAVGIDSFLVRFDPSGAANSPLRFGGENAGTEVRVAGVAVGAGGIFLSGSFRGAAVDFNPTAGIRALTQPDNDDGFVLRLQDMSTFRWAHQFGTGGADDSARGIALDPVGNVVFTGGFHGTVNFNPAGGAVNVPSVNAVSDAYVTKLDQLGNLVWVKTAGGTAPAAGTDVAVDARGYVYVAGDFAGQVDFNPDDGESFVLAAVGGTDVSLSKLDADGNFVLAGRLGGAGTDTAAGIAVKGEGTVTAVGSFTGRTDVEPFLGTYSLNAGGTDGFVSQFGEFNIRGAVWRDLDGNGVKDTGEPPLPDAVVTLIDTVDGIRGNGDDVAVATQTVTGDYEFVDPPDSLGYYVRITPAAAISGDSAPAYLVSAPGQGTDDTADSDLNGSNESRVVRRSQGPVANLGGGFRTPPLVAGGWAVGGGGGAETGRAITRDAAGNTYVAGTFEGQVDFDPRIDENLRAATGKDGFVAKYDRDGALLWVRQIGGSLADEATAVALDPAGNVLVAGTFEGTATFEGSTTTPLTAHFATGQPNVADVFVLKLGSDGSFKWAKRLGGNKLEAASGIAADADGNVITVGAFEGTADFDPAEPKIFNLTNASTTTATRDVFISKLTKEGVFVFAKKFGNTGDESVAGVALDATGNIYTTGRYDGSVDFNPGTPVNNLTGGGTFVSRLDNAGNYRWAVNTGNTAVTGLAVAGDRLYTAGAALHRLDLNGGVTWNRTLVGEPLAVAADASGAYITGRFTGSPDFDPGAGVAQRTAVGTDAFVSKFDSEGAFVYAHALGGAGTDEGRAIVAGPGGAVRVTGSFETAADFDIGPAARTITANGAGDAFVWAVPGGGVTGQIWNDLDGNGLREPNEPAVPGVVVKLFKENGATDIEIDTRVSGPDGSYRFEGVAPGASYYLRATLPILNGLGFTGRNLNENDDLDNDLDGAGLSDTFVLNGAVPAARDIGVSGVIPPFGSGWTGGPGESSAFANTTDANGNVYVTGEFKGSVDFAPGAASEVLTSTGNSYNAFAAKYTSAGILLWAKAFRTVTGTGTANDIGGQGIAVDAAGNVLVTGRFQGTADFNPGAGVDSLVSKGGYDAFVVKLDSQGNFVRAGQLGGAFDDQGNAIAAGDNRIYVTGYFRKMADFNPDAVATSALTSQGDQDAFVTALTADGMFVWARQAGGAGLDDVGRAITTGVGGSVFVAGSFSGTADFDPGAAVLDQTSHGLKDAFVWKLDSTGNIGSTGWAAQAGGPLNDDANALAVIPGSAESVVVTGSFAGTADFDRGPLLMEALSQGAEDVFVWRLDDKGQPVWAKGLGGPAGDVGNAVTANGTGVYIAGSFASFGAPADFDPDAGRLTLTSGSDTEDAFVAKLDLDGGRQWAHRLGGDDTDAGRGIAVDASGLVTFSGKLTGAGTFDPGDGDQGLAGGLFANFFFARVSQTLVGDAFPLDSFEPNGDAGKATDLGVVNRSAELDGLTLSSLADEDWFRFSLLTGSEAANKLVLDVAAGHGPVTVSLLKDGVSANTFSRTVSAGGLQPLVAELSLATLDPGEYLVKVTGSPNPDYKLRLELPEGFAKDDREDNNSRATASLLTLESPQTTVNGLSINVPGDEDWFAFDLDDEGTASSEARIDFRNSLGDLGLELFDANGVSLRISAGLDDSESISLAGLPEGRYFLRVTGNQGAINPAYSLTVRPPRSLTPDGFEPNNTQLTAKSLDPANGERTWEDLSIHLNGNEDWYKFTLTARGQAGHLAAIDFVHAEGDLDLRLYDSTSVNPVATSTGNTDSELISLQGLDPGLYFLKVSGFSGATQASYNLRTVTPVGTTLADRLEGSGGNEAKKTASVVQTPGKIVLEGSQTLVDLTLTVKPGAKPNTVTTDEDWFKFTTVGKGTAQHNVVLTYPAANGTLGLELYNAAGAKVATGIGAGGTLVAPLKGLAKGTYYARTFIPKSGSVGSGYSLAFDVPASESVVTLDDWTIMVYMTADTLAERAFNDINEMEAAVAGLPGSVNFAVMWDQSANRTIYPTANSTQKAWATTGMGLVSPDTNPGQIATKFEILPEKNSGHPDTLKAFVEWAKKNAPANHYALVFWDHGDGLRGFNFDSQDGQTPDHLTTSEVTTALTGHDPLDLIAFDACFMGVAEVAYNLRDEAAVVVASQDAIPGDGYEYDLAFNALRTNPAGVSAVTLATGIVQSYGARYGSTGRADTLAAVRTAELDDLATALGVFSTAAQAATVEDKKKLVAAAAGAVLPGRSADEQRDLGSFLAAVDADGSLPVTVRNAAKAALEKFRGAVISRTSDLRNNSGLSVYLPVSDLDLLTINPERIDNYGDLGTDYAEFAATANWPALLISLADATDDRPTEGDGDDKLANNGSQEIATNLQVLGANGIPKNALNLYPDGDEDWYRFEVTEAESTLAADITAGGTIFADLVRAADMSVTSAVNNRIRREKAPAGTYYLHFYANTEIPNYSFVIQPPAAAVDPAGDNTTPPKAYQLPPKTPPVYSGMVVNPAVGLVPGQDWLRFDTTVATPPELRRVTVFVSNGQTLRAQLRSSTGYVVSSDEGSGTLILPYTQGSAETYTLVILNPNPTPVSYSLSLDPATSLGVTHPLEQFGLNGNLATNPAWTVTATGKPVAEPMSVANGRVTVNAATARAMRKSDAALGDTAVQARFKLAPEAPATPKTQLATVMARVNGTADKPNAYEATLQTVNKVTTAILYRTVNGVSAKIAFAAGPKLAPGAEGVLRLEAQGRVLRLLVDGKPYLEFTDTYVMPGGWTGFGGSAGVSFDDFQANAIAVSLPLGYSTQPGLGGEWQAVKGAFTALQDSFVTGSAPAGSAVGAAVATALYNPARLADVKVTAGYALRAVGDAVSLFARHNGLATGASFYEAKVVWTKTGIEAVLSRNSPGAKPLKMVKAGVPQTGTWGLEVRGNEVILILNGVAQAAVPDKSVLLPGRTGLSATANMAVSNFNVTAAEPPFEDRFNRPNNASLGAKWTQPGTKLRIEGNRMKADAEEMALASHTALKNVSVSASFDLSSNPNLVGLIARHAGGSYYEARLTPAGQPGKLTAAILLVSGGASPVTLKSMTVAKATAGTLQFELDGTSLKLSVFGESLSVTDKLITAAGATGVRLGAGDGIDDFLVR